MRNFYPIFPVRQCEGLFAGAKICSYWRRFVRKLPKHSLRSRFFACKSGIVLLMRSEKRSCLPNKDGQEKDSLLSSPFRTNFEAREKRKKGEKRNVWKRAESSQPSHVRG